MTENIVQEKVEIEADGFLFTFTNVIEAYVFDEKDRNSPKFHNAPMKAVDVIAEFEDKYIYVEMKDFHDISYYDIGTATTEEDRKEKQKHFKHLKEYLKYKFRDSYLYRYAEGKVEKPIIYICLLNFDNALNSKIQRALQQELPIARVSPSKWIHSIAQNCFVINLNKWNERFSQWPLVRI